MSDQIPIVDDFVKNVKLPSLGDKEFFWFITITVLTDNEGVAFFVKEPHCLGLDAVDEEALIKALSTHPGLEFLANAPLGGATWVISSLTVARVSCITYGFHKIVPFKTKSSNDLD